MLTPVLCNAKVQMPMIAWKHLIAFTALYCGLYPQRGTAEQWIKEDKNAVKLTRLSCCTFRNNAVRLQLHALAYNLANVMRTLALPK